MCSIERLGKSDSAPDGTLLFAPTKLNREIYGGKSQEEGSQRIRLGGQESLVALQGKVCLLYLFSSCADVSNWCMQK